MAVTVLSFSQKGCMACAEQAPINKATAAALGIVIEELDALATHDAIAKYQLKVTPTIVIVKDGEIKEKLEGVIQQEQLEAAVRKYL